MAASLAALLAGAIDYAGMFPPAALSLDRSARNFLKYRDEPEAWMLGRFVCPAARWKELAPLIGDATRSAVVLGGGATDREWRENVARDLSVLPEHFSGFGVEAIEVRLPDSLAGLGTDAEFRAAADPLLPELAECERRASVVFVESPALPPETREAEIERLVNWLAERRQTTGAGDRLAFKLRTGGATPRACLSSAELARAICLLRDQAIFWKATAGLHQPLPHYDRAAGATAHGFVNVLTAAAMAEIHHLPESEVQAILDDGNADSFQGSANQWHWKRWGASAEQIARARRRSLVSFGSCSFDEPRDGLRALGWL